MRFRMQLTSLEVWLVYRTLILSGNGVLLQGSQHVTAENHVLNSQIRERVSEPCKVMPTGQLLGSIIPNC